MKIIRSATLPADVEDAFAIIATQEYQQEKVSAQAERSSARVTEVPGGLVIAHTERTVATRGMPPTVVSMVGDTLTITEQQTWHQPEADGRRRADLKITIAGLPMRLLGTISLSPADAGSAIVVDAELICSIPLVGKMIEQAAAPTIGGSIEHEARLLNERLA